MNRRRVLLALASLVVLLSAEPAAAGGSEFAFDQGSYAPGDRAVAVAVAALYHLDEADDGPYGAWLIPVGAPNTSTEIPQDAVYIGELVVHDEPYDGGPIAPFHVSIEFTVPDLGPGGYTIVNCNQPCTDPLPDITWGGRMTVDSRAVAPTTVAPTTVAPTTTATDLAVEPLVADDSSSGSSGPLLAAGVVALGVGLGAIAWRLRPRSQATPKPA